MINYLDEFIYLTLVKSEAVKRYTRNYFEEYKYYVVVHLFTAVKVKQEHYFIIQKNIYKTFMCSDCLP